VAFAELQLDFGGVAAAIALLSSDEGAPRDCRWWTALSAAYLAEWWLYRDSARSLVLALDAATAATEIDGARPEPWFNQAVILGHLGLREEAVQAWERWSQVESDSGWRSEGARLRAPMQSSRQQDGATPSLTDASGSKDAAITAGTPQASREFLEDVLLPLWGQAHTAGHDAEAAMLLRRASRLANALEAVAGDTLDSRTVRLITHSADKAVLARTALGLVAYGHGRTLYEANSWEAAGDRFTTAISLLSASQSPIAHWARLQLALVLYQRRHLAEAERVLNEVLGPAEIDGYLTAGARAHWLLGLVQMQTGGIERALDSYTRSISLWERTKEFDNVAAVAGTAADTLRVSGNHELGWRYLMIALARLPELQSVRRRYTLMLNASLYSSDETLARAAMVFQNASLKEARNRGVPSTIAEGLIRRATLRSRQHADDGSASDLEEARGLIEQIASATSRNYQLAWWHSASVESLLPSDPNLALSHARRALDHFNVLEPAEVPRLRLLEGRAHVALGDTPSAETAFQRGVASFEARWAQLAQPHNQISYLDDSWSLFHELLELHATRGEFGLALSRAESVRARALRAGGAARAAPDLRPSTVQRRVAPGTVVVYYALLERHLLIWCITSLDWTVRRVDIDSKALSHQIASYRRRLELGVEPETIDRLARGLHAQLVSPITRELTGARTLVFIGDASIQAVPFATLLNGASGRYLIEDYAISTSPSLVEFLASSERLSQPVDRSSVRALVVGAGRASRELGLPPLPEASREVAEVAQLYADAATLTNEDATPARLAQLAARYEVLHFAGHARANLRFPSESDLVLLPDDSHRSGRLTAAEIATWRLAATHLVVLSACRTVFGPVYKGEGVIGLARPFLAAGVPAVIGSLWDVRDASSRTLLGAFHRLYVDSGDAVSALRLAQLQLLRDPEARFNSPSHWGAYSLISGIPRARP
jgi:CHAT domain-containing protein